MDIAFHDIELTKRYPLRISRGISTGSTNLWVTMTAQGQTGIGECAPGVRTGAADAAACRAELTRFLRAHSLEEMSPTAAWRAARDMDIAPCAWAGLDIAWWDWLGKRAGLPLYQVFGLGNAPVPSSVTIGINPPEVVRERVPEILERTGARYLKVKLGSPEGDEADRAMFEAVVEVTAGRDVGIRVDANGGWGLDTARSMIRWLAGRGAEYVEQPLADTDDDRLPELFADRALPIYIDESCNFATDVVRLARCVDGVNLKLMKCAGLTEALRIVATARAFGLKTMIGCMGESSVSISAGAAIGELFDYIDLDSQLNLAPDPATGAVLTGGVVTPTDAPGHGARPV